MNSTSWASTFYVTYYWSAIFDNYEKISPFYMVIGSFLERKSMVWMWTKELCAIFTSLRRLISIDMRSLVLLSFDFLLGVLCESWRNQSIHSTDRLISRMDVVRYFHWLIGGGAKRVQLNQIWPRKLDIKL